MDNFWKGAFSPVLRKHVVSYRYGNRALDAVSGEIYQEVYIDFGGATNGKPWGSIEGGYLYYLSPDFIPEDDLYELMDDADIVEFDPSVRVISQPDSEAYAF